ncbi:MAG: Uncharacterized protein G01um101416_164 [Microgenomates group bacterium Gr01-1014_16]|nr:MAG: Uncharacterized protein G01um101416_164 [Microgenomates group bacterium Gr01-1014_16]
MKPGQTLIFLLVFITMAITVTTAATLIIISNSQAASKLEQSLTAYAVAESGAENALLRLLRDPAYAGETLTIGGGIATISATGSNPKVILSKGAYRNFLRQVQVTANYVSGILTVTSWQEVF